MKFRLIMLIQVEVVVEEFKPWPMF